MRRVRSPPQISRFAGSAQNRLKGIDIKYTVCFIWSVYHFIPSDFYSHPRSKPACYVLIKINAAAEHISYISGLSGKEKHKCTQHGLQLE